MSRRYMLALLFALSANLAHAEGQPALEPAREPVREPGRGELLYNTHCIACHSTRVHWRDRTLALNWKSLRSEVRRWQKMSGLRWSDEDIDAVALYLNRLYYHYPMPD